MYVQHYAHEAQFQTLQTKQSRDADVLFERRIVVTEYSISSSRFSLELKVNMKSLANQQVSVIDEVTLSMKQHNLHESSHESRSQ